MTAQICAQIFCDFFVVSGRVPLKLFVCLFVCFGE